MTAQKPKPKAVVDTRPYELGLLRGMYDRATARVIATEATSHHFAHEDTLAVFKSFQRLHFAGMTVTHQTLHLDLTSSGVMTRDDAENTLAAIEQLPPLANAKHLINGLGQLMAQKQLGDLTEYLQKPEAIKNGLAGAMHKINEFVMSHHEVVGKKSETLVESMQRAIERSGHDTVWRPGLGRLDDYWKIRKGSYTVIGGDSGSGKAQPLDAKILTPSGFVTMGSLKAGDVITSASGGTTRVVGIFPQGVMPVYKVTTTDGCSTECTDDHLWLTSTMNDRKRLGHGRVRTLNQIRHSLKRESRSNACNHAIPHTPLVQWQHQGNMLPIHPYVLGVLIGDASMRVSIKLHNPEPDIQSRVSSLLHDGDKMNVASDGITCYIIRKIRTTSPSYTKMAMNELGLGECRSWEKFIPKRYLMAAVDDRIELVRGLFDTDGSVCQRGQRIEYTTSSEQLSRDVAFLCRSLGGIVSIKPRIPKYTYKGQRLTGRVSYRMSIQFPSGIIPVSSEKHLARWRGTQVHNHRSIKSVEYVGEKECQCIAVDSPDHLYVTDDFIVTHNTALMVNMVLSIAKQGSHVGVISIEMSTDELTYRAAAMECGVPHERIEDNTMSDGERQILYNYMVANKDLYERIHVVDPAFVSAEELHGLYNDFVATYGCEVVFVDYIQRIGSKDKAVSSKIDKVSHASETLTAVTKATGVATVALSVLARDHNASKKGLDHLKHSGQIGHDAHTVVILTPEATDGPPGEEKLIRIEAVKNRKGPFFAETLLLHGPTQRITHAGFNMGYSTQDRSEQ